MLFTKASARKSIDDAEVARVLADVDGTELTETDEGVSVAKVEVTHELDRPGSFVVETADLTPDDLEWIEGTTVQEGAPVKIAMGWTEKGDPVFAGEVLGIELEVSSASSPRIAIRGFDRLHRLARARRSRAFAQKRDSEIAGDLALEHGLRLVGPQTKVIHPYVLQADQTDLAFLRARARPLGFVVRVDDTKLHFAPRGLTGSPVATAALGDNLLEFFVRTSVLGLAGAAEARGWDPAAQKAIVGKASKVPSLMGGKTAGFRRADESFSAQVTRADGPIVIADDATLTAAGVFETAALDHVVCEGKMLGAAVLRPGDILEVTGIGKRFSGNYWLTRVVHRYDHTGFTTSFDGRRTAS
jgi:phage protein D